MPQPIGTDGIQPVYDPSGRWTVWSIHEIWQGTTGTNRYVPKVGDYVVDPDSYTTYIVLSLNTDLTSVLEIKQPPWVAEAFDPPDVLLGVGPGTQSDMFRAYLDTSVSPNTITFDTRTFIYSALSKYCKVFYGSIIDDGNVLSMVYDSSNNFVTNNVTLELAGQENLTNVAIKYVPTFATNKVLADGEVITAVIYNDAGGIVSKRQFLIENTVSYRDVNSAQKFITDIGIESLFLSDTVADLIMMPYNVPVSSLGLKGVVNYSDGSSIKMPIDGNKFTLLGLDQYIASIVGQKTDLVLKYTLSVEESAQNVRTISGNSFITKPISIVTSNPDNTYSVKLYGYPEYQGDNVGYTMRWFLVSMDRNIFFDVTEFIVFASNTGTYNPKSYGTLQRKSVQLDLSKVSSVFKPYILSQLVDINLVSAPNGTITPWTMSQIATSDIPVYGDNLYATCTSTDQFATVDITSGITNVNTWLSKVYNNTHPLINPNIELTPPVPTHIGIIYNGIERIYDISHWNTRMQTASAVANARNVYIRFINQASDGTQLTLSIAAMLITQVS